MIRFLRKWLRADEPQGALRQQLDAFAATEVEGIVPPKSVYAEPDRSMTHQRTKNDDLAIQLRRARQQKVTPMRGQRFRA